MPATQDQKRQEELKKFETDVQKILDKVVTPGTNGSVENINILNNELEIPGKKWQADELDVALKLLGEKSKQFTALYKKFLEEARNRNNTQDLFLDKDFILTREALEKLQAKIEAQLKKIHDDEKAAESLTNEQRRKNEEDQKQAYERLKAQHKDFFDMPAGSGHGSILDSIANQAGYDPISCGVAALLTDALYLTRFILGSRYWEMVIQYNQAKNSSDERVRATVFDPKNITEAQRKAGLKKNSSFDEIASMGYLPPPTYPKSFDLDFNDFMKIMGPSSVHHQGGNPTPGVVGLGAQPAKPAPSQAPKPHQ